MNKLVKRNTNIGYTRKISKMLRISSIIGITTCCYIDSAHAAGFWGGEFTEKSPFDTKLDNSDNTGHGGGIDIFNGESSRKNPGGGIDVHEPGREEADNLSSAENTNETVILERWDHLDDAKSGCNCISKCHGKKEEGSSSGYTFATYTLNPGKSYQFGQNTSLQDRSILVIPQNTAFTNKKELKFNFGTRSKLENKGTFTNIGKININGDYGQINNNGAFINDGEILINKVNDCLTLLGNKSIVNKNMLCITEGELFVRGGLTLVNEGIQSRLASICISGMAGVTIHPGSTLLFGAFSTFYSQFLDNGVILNGILKITSKDAKIDTKNLMFAGSGSVDMSLIRAYPEVYSEDVKTTLNLSDYSFNTERDKPLPNVILPFNCKFSKIKLSRAKSVSYTI